MGTEYTQEIVFGFDEQSAKGTYSATLDGVSGTWGVAAGLLLGSSGTGVADSGLSLTVGRVGNPKAPASGSFTRDLSEFLRAETSTFSVTVPFVGSRATTTGTPVDADFDLSTDLPGLDALLKAAGLDGAASGTPGHEYTFGYSTPISALIYAHSNRIEVVDCVATGWTVDAPPGETPTLTVTLTGVINAHELEAGPTPTYGVQQSVSPPITGNPAAGFTWGTARGFSSFSLSVTPTVNDTPDSEAAPTGIRSSVDDRETTASATLWMDSASSGETFAYNQLIETVTGNLSSLSWTCGAAASGADAAKAWTLTIPDPEVTSWTPTVLDGKAALDVELRASGATADTELQIEFV